MGILDEDYDIWPAKKMGITTTYAINVTETPTKKYSIIE